MFINTKKSEIKFEDLNAKCLVQISKFARALYQLNGTVLKLQTKNIIEQITYHCEDNQSPQLHKIYAQLRIEIRNLTIDLQMNNSLLAFSMPHRNFVSQPLLN